MDRFGGLLASIPISFPTIQENSLELLGRDVRTDGALILVSKLVGMRGRRVSVISTVLAFFVLILAGCGGSSPNAANGTAGNKQQAIVSIVSKPSQVLAGTTFQFMATVVGISGDPGVTWAVPTPNGGSIDATGLYVAPTSGTFPMSVTVTATYQAAPADTTSTSFTVTQNGQHGVVTITAIPFELGAGANWQFNATVAGASDNQGVNWTVATPGGGTIDSTGLYIAPTSGTFPLSVSVTATSQADANVYTTSNFTIAQSDPLGSATGTAITCPTFSGGLTGASCYRIDTSCPGVADFSAYLKVNQPVSTPVGTVLFGTGTGGAALYDNDPLFVEGSTNGGLTVVQSVLNAGYATVQVTFGSPFAQQPSGWLTGPGGVRKLACRYATVAQWVYQNIHKSNTSAPLCATGNSGGAGAIGYALTDYGMNSIFSMVEETSGPPMSRLDQGCLPASNVACQKQQFTCNAGSPAQNLSVCYTPDEAKIIDTAYSEPVCSNAVNGITPPNGLLLSDSILGGIPPTFAKTRVNVLLGGQDNSTAVEQALLWVNSVTNTSKSQACVSDAPHPIPSVADGASTIAADIQNLCK